MTRSPSFLAQLGFDAASKLYSLNSHPNRAAKLFARYAGRTVIPLAKRLGQGHTVRTRLYGHDLVMPAEHFLPGILRVFPQFNRPLSLAIEAIAASQEGRVSVIDVGANIGDSVASIEQHLPNKCVFLCLEPDRDLAELCVLNHAGNERVEVKRCYIGENEGEAVRLQDDGRGNPSTRLGGTDTVDQLVRLDTIAAVFAKSHGLHVIKTDTEGYDFSVLRSAPNLLSEYKPTVYFEWFPEVLRNVNEQIMSGFEYLAKFGYRHFVFFTSEGDFYCELSDPDSVSLQRIAGVTGPKMEYFDVCASTDEAITDRLTVIIASQRIAGQATRALHHSETTPQLAKTAVRLSSEWR